MAGGGFRVVGFGVILGAGCWLMRGRVGCGRGRSRRRFALSGCESGEIAQTAAPSDRTSGIGPDEARRP